MEAPASLAALKAVSRRIGLDLRLAQGPGGNTSIKDGGVLWIKASGTWLAEAETKEIFVPVDLAGARRALAAGSETMPVIARDGAPALRASIETSLHALLPHAVVLHAHAINTIAWACRTDGDDELARRLAGLAWAKLPYVRPGLPLSQAVAELTSRQTPDVLILGNHGLVVAGADCAAAEALMREVERRLALPPLRPAPAFDLARLQAVCADGSYRPAIELLCHRLATDPENLRIATAGSLYPDHVVFLGPALPVFAADRSLAALRRERTADGLPMPVAMLVSDAGAIVRADILPAAELMLQCLALVAERLSADAGVSYLPPEEEQALLDWDAERYRKQLSTTNP
ncbi:MAG TPA: class II aldolase/adducin family protein [Hypericibacter adhaerens]|uniref:class II aldolase/adducin family protein n=1 Tax=Hypericibacter adhaerens TaxID=2602016 RepID=UPI002BABD72B|nr:class II aldolase/adducin family protein [Hypericibacter adhaerens]HWA44168.1 class II aldolase/adducin family protein [Hypericibacter adhaerens]